MIPNWFDMIFNKQSGFSSIPNITKIDCVKTKKKMLPFRTAVTLNGSQGSFKVVFTITPTMKSIRSHMSVQKPKLKIL